MSEPLAPALDLDETVGGQNANAQIICRLMLGVSLEYGEPAARCCEADRQAPGIVDA